MIKDNLLNIKSKLKENVKLLAVSKFHPAQAVIEAFDAGQTSFGENRVQEASQKFSEVRKILEERNNTDASKLSLHIIGNLQRNKVKEAVKIADVIESVDRKELLMEIEKQSAKINKKIEIYFEFHTGEESKSGYQTTEELFDSMDSIKSGLCPHCIPKGFMTMAPNTQDKDEIRNAFRKLKAVFDEAKEKYPEFDLTELSMGMSGDYEIAMEEGSTQVRVGTAIFGERNYA